MKVKEEVKKEESKLNESSLTDLPVADGQADATKGGEGFEKKIEIMSFNFGVDQSSGLVR